MLRSLCLVGLTVALASAAGGPDGCESRGQVPPCFKELLQCASDFFKAEKVRLF